MSLFDGVLKSSIPQSNENSSYMYSQTLIGMDLFAAAENLRLAGALRTCDVVKFPFDPQLWDYIVRTDPIWEDLMYSVFASCGFDPALRTRACELREAHAPSPAGGQLGAEALNAWMLLIAGHKAWQPIDFNDRIQLEQWTQRCEQRNMTQLFDNVLQAGFCFGSGSATLHVPIKQITLEALALAASSLTLGTSRDERRAFLTAYGWWKKSMMEYGFECIHDELYRQWLQQTIMPALEE